MGQAFIDLLADPAKREQMSAFGKRRVAEGLSWDQSQAVLIDFYNRLLGHAVAEQVVADSRRCA